MSTYTAQITSPLGRRDVSEVRETVQAAGTFHEVRVSDINGQTAVVTIVLDAADQSAAELTVARLVEIVPAARVEWVRANHPEA
ncbi:hypothetical protein [Cellulomonas fimi]|uniref:Uncharacterized protein n=1 Tax=Cellulomonas fimi TaxID=1708 RepID=A0A7Y0LY19_CELFI|nr:hypothetical protein [Cellulomonas fimi]NMR19453.1 hypothetical protein [Cellulomonas fimi]